MRIFRSILVLIFIGLSITSFSQPVFLKQYIRQGTDRVNASIISSDEYAYVSGSGVNLAQGSGAMPMLSKFDLAGNMIWSRTYGPWTNGSIVDLIENFAGNIVVVGYGFQPGEDVTGFIIEMDTSGNVVRKRGCNFDDGMCLLKIKQNLAGSYVVLGNYTENVSYDGYGIYAVFDTLLAPVIVKAMSGFNMFPDLVLDNAGNSYVAATVSLLPNIEVSIVTIFKLDPSGNIVWYRDLHTWNDISRSICWGADSTLMVLSSVNLDIIWPSIPRDEVMKVDTSGNLIWINEYLNLTLPTTGTRLISRNLTNDHVILGTDGTMYSIDDNGNMLWQRIVSPSPAFKMTTLMEMSNGQIISFGEISSAKDILFARFDVSGNAYCNQQSASLMINPSQHFLRISQSSAGNANLQNVTGISSYAMTATESTLCSSALGTETNEDFASKPIVFPNPFNQQFYIEIEHTSISHLSSIQLFDITGKMIGIEQVQEGSKVWVTPKQKIEQGVYQIMIRNKDNTQSSLRVVKLD